MAEATEKTITTEDGSTLSVGDVAWNYYDGFAVRLVWIEDDGWADTKRLDGTRGPMLNGERMCSVAHAKSRGWIAD